MAKKDKKAEASEPGAPVEEVSLQEEALADALAELEAEASEPGAAAPVAVAKAAFIHGDGQTSHGFAKGDEVKLSAATLKHLAENGLIEFR